MNSSLPGSCVHEIFWAEILWVASPTPENFPNPGIKPVSLASPTLAGRFFTTEPPEKPHKGCVDYFEIGC